MVGYGGWNEGWGTLGRICTLLKIWSGFRWEWIWIRAKGGFIYGYFVDCGHEGNAVNIP